MQEKSRDWHDDIDPTKYAKLETKHEDPSTSDSPRTKFVKNRGEPTPLPPLKVNWRCQSEARVCKEPKKKKEKEKWWLDIHGRSCQMWKMRMF